MAFEPKHPFDRALETGVNQRTQLSVEQLRKAAHVAGMPTESSIDQMQAKDDLAVRRGIKDGERLTAEMRIKVNEVLLRQKIDIAQIDPDYQPSDELYDKYTARLASSEDPTADYIAPVPHDDRAWALSEAYNSLVELGEQHHRGTEAVSAGIRQQLTIDRLLKVTVAGFAEGLAVEYTISPGERDSFNRAAIEIAGFPFE